MTLCHYCGYEQTPPALCPKCGQSQVRYQGLGTEKLQAEIRSSHPGLEVEVQQGGQLHYPFILSVE